MPTVHVRPRSDLQLQEIGDSLWKARKVVVVTGAGISTNSGIPDFRSENGLYSLIQAQFDAATKAGDGGSEQGVYAFNLPSESECQRPTKRRRISTDDGGTVGIVPNGEASNAYEAQSLGLDDDDSVDKVELVNQNTVPQSTQGNPDVSGDVQNTDLVTMRSKLLPGSGRLSLRSSPVPELPHGPASLQSEGSTSTTTSSALKGASSTEVSTPLTAPNSDLEQPPPISFSSSPLSSPPPVLFDPYENLQSDSTPSGRSSTSSSEVGETPPSSNTFLSSQSSNSSRHSLPNLKGRDLFDASIWSDPTRTSVFYTFTTTLRQKVKNVVPTTSHQFISHLRDAGKLVRCYTQNIDEIEQKVGLTTSLDLGPGSRGRFSRSGPRHSSGALPASHAESDGPVTQPKENRVPVKAADRGVECVFLHGSLHGLRCFMCGQISNWDEGGREYETLSGRQPSCPRCEGATAAREERGKRALGVGKLRPDIVLYGEEHPSAHLISPIVQHDLSLAPDMMLILGTSLRVHGLKVMVKEFAKAVHNKGGKVVFVNFTKPPDSVWSDIIDYWVEWDCDAWVQDLKEKKPVIWRPPSLVLGEEEKNTSKGKRESAGGQKTHMKRMARRESLEAQEAKLPKSEAKRPVAIRDHKGNGAYLVWKIMDDLAKFSGRSASTPPSPVTEMPPPKRKRTRLSAPAELEKRRKSSTRKVVVVKPRKKPKPPSLTDKKQDPKDLKVTSQSQAGAHESVVPETDIPIDSNSILAAVKSNPRKRKRKTIDGIEVTLPGQRPTITTIPRVQQAPPTGAMATEDDKENPPWQRTDRIISHLSHLPSPLPDPKYQAPLPLPFPKKPLQNFPSSEPFALPRIAPISSYTKSTWSPLPAPTPLEPSPTLSVPLAPISPNLGSAMSQRMGDPFFYSDPLAIHFTYPPPWQQDCSPSDQLMREQDERAEAAMTLSGLRGTFL